MGYTAQPGAAYNVEGSFNDFFATQLTAKGIPSWLPSAVVGYDWPDKPVTYPMWSVTHLGSIPQEIAQGRTLDPGWRGARRVGLAEIDCWCSFQWGSASADAQIAQMRDMASRVFATGASFPIKDLYGTLNNPTGNGTIVRAKPVEDAGRIVDPNPDIVRRKLTVQYSWLERASAG